MYWIAPIGFLVSALSVYLVLHFSDRLGLIDIPTPRSFHEEPMPRGGGLGILLSICVLLALYFALGYWGNDHRAFIGLITGTLIVGITGFMDDIRTPPLPLRLMLQVLAATVAIIGIGSLKSIDFPHLGTLGLGVLSVPISLLWIVAVTNIYNFMDGIDGLAAGQGVIAGGFLAYIGSTTGNAQVSAIGLFVAAASLGFLLFNFPPAKIFMGDVGSTTLGFTFAAVAIMGPESSASPIPFLAFVIILGSFLFDSTVTLIRRALRKEKLHEAHRSHFYQIAVQLGYSHKQVTLVEYVIMILLGASSIFYVRCGEAVQLSLLILWLLALSAIGLWLLSKSRSENG